MTTACGKERSATPSVGANSSVLAPWMAYRLGGASLSRQNGLCREHVDADRRKLAPAKIHVSRSLGDQHRN